MDIDALSQRMIEAVKGYVARALDPLSARLSAVETRIAALAMMRADSSVGGSDALRVLGNLDARLKQLETKPRLSYHGVWRAGEYQAGSLATDKGCLWHAWQVTSDRPGTSDAWQLMAKSGRDR